MLVMVNNSAVKGLPLGGGKIDQRVPAGQGHDACHRHVCVVDRAVIRGAGLILFFLVTLAPLRTLETSFCCG